jgi:hypothetical protein
MQLQVAPIQAAAAAAAVQHQALLTQLVAQVAQVLS